MNLAMAELLLSDFINPFYFFPVKIYNVSVSNACIYVYYVYEVDPNDGHQKKNWTSAWKKRRKRL